jgi:1,2-diacylglycerol 3-beta-glucosyltransferase
MFDAFFQQQRIAAGGLGELRGNGQFIRRTALEQCGGFNEETITDDLDLTFRLHLDQWDIAFCFHPHVGEEGVTRPLALWHQRNRWAEGGYQRCLDYWHLISRNRMGTKKSLDLLCFFWITQYLLPTVTLPDLMMAILRNRPPIYAPLGALTVTFSMVTMFLGIRQARLKVPLHGAQPEPRSAMTTVAILSQTIQGVLYMLHWFVVMASTMVRMSVRPKRLKWVKTTHHGETAPTTDGVPV